jgi:quercetin dioxygenase-like cupin family protein
VSSTYQRCIVDIRSLPSVHRDPEPRRQVRLPLSPATTGDTRFLVTHVIVPPHGISSGHVHDECDEIIYFSGPGRVQLGEEVYELSGESLVTATRGVWHECVNTSGSQELTLLCFFVPPFKPFDVFVQLTEDTRRHLASRPLLPRPSRPL